MRIAEYSKMRNWWFWENSDIGNAHGLLDTNGLEFSGAVEKNKGDDNDTCNWLINSQALYNLDFYKENITY